MTVNLLLRFCLALDFEINEIFDGIKLLNKKESRNDKFHSNVCPIFFDEYCIFELIIFNLNYMLYYLKLTSLFLLCKSKFLIYLPTVALDI